jgi:hypothetical protein
MHDKYSSTIVSSRFIDLRVFAGEATDADMQIGGQLGGLDLLAESQAIGRLRKPITITRTPHASELNWAATSSITHLRNRLILAVTLLTMRLVV